MAEVIRMPRMSDTMTEGTFVEWHKKVGDVVKNGDILAEVETDKATMELENYVKGILLYIGVEKGGIAQVDQVIAIVGKEGEDFSALLVGDTKKKTEELSLEKVSEKTNEIKKEILIEQVSSDDRLKASPLAKKIAEDKGLNISEIKGSGPDGRIIKKDVEEFHPLEKELEVQNDAGEKIKPVVIEALKYTGEESFEELAVSQMRKTIAARLSASKFGAPHFYLTVSVNMDQAIAARKSMNEVALLKISFNDLVIKASALSLRQHPAVNSSWLGDKIRINHHVHIGIAVAIPDGLVVPVIRFADQKTLTQITAEVNDVAEKAKNKKLQPQDWEGNTFTISNLGMMGIEEFTAIINPPDACILAVGGIQQIPIVKNGEIKIGNMMKLTLSCDHRVVDGAVGARFLQTLKNYLEEPVRMLV